MKHARAAGSQSTILILTVAAAILLPLILALAWGRHFSAADFTLLHFAREMANGNGIIIDTVASIPVPHLNSLLFAMLVALPAGLGLEPAWAALILSAIGWSVASIAILAIGQSLRRFRGAIITALLLSFSPVIITTLGGPASWIIALGWLTLALLLRRHVVFAILTFLLLTILLLPWPLRGGWSHLSHYVAAVAWSVLLFAVGVGVDWLAAELASRDLVRLPYPQIANLLLAAVFVFFGIGQVTGIWQLFQSRPQKMWRLEEDVAAWLQSETEGTAKLLASERIGYLAQRSTITVPDSPQLATAAALQTFLQTQSVDYLVTSNELPWQQLQELTWFRLAYEPLEQFNTSYLPQSPLTIWAYQEPVAELGERYSINARVPDRLSILGYQTGPQQAQPGDSVQIALYLQAPEATSVPAVPFQAIVRLISPIDGSTESEWSVDLPQSVPLSEWQTNNVYIEQFQLDIPDALESGAYNFNLSLIGKDSSEMWPISLDKDINRLDRIPIGGLIVPWDSALMNFQAVGAVFAEEIELSGYSMNKPEPGKLLEVDLFWQAYNNLDEDYTVFVHVLSIDGELVASHDSPPDNGRFPTPTWLPGIIIPDRHGIQIPDNLPSGEYFLMTGLYRPETGERLSISSADNEDNTLLVTKILIP